MDATVTSLNNRSEGVQNTEGNDKEIEDQSENEQLEE